MPKKKNNNTADILFSSGLDVPDFVCFSKGKKQV